MNEHNEQENSTPLHGTIICLSGFVDVSGSDVMDTVRRNESKMF